MTFGLSFIPYRSWETVLISFEPNSVIRDRTDYVRMSSRLSAAFAKGVAGYAEEERQRRCRQSTEISW